MKTKLIIKLAWWIGTLLMLGFALMVLVVVVPEIWKTARQYPVGFALALIILFGSAPVLLSLCWLWRKFKR